MLNKNQIKTLLEYFPGGVVAIDFETTGLIPTIHKIIDAAAVKVSADGEVSIFNELINPGAKIPAETIKIHHITDDMVKDKPHENEVIPKFIEFLGELPIIAHNAQYDIGFLTYTAHHLSINFSVNEVYCSCQFARSIVKDARRHRLATLIEHFNIDFKNTHRALDDTFACIAVFAQTLQVMKDKGETDKLKQAGLLFDLGKFKKEKSYELPKKFSKLGQYIQNHEILDIIYMGGSHKGKWRPVQPASILPLPQGLCLQALCLLENRFKVFRLDRIKDIRISIEKNEWLERLKSMSPEEIVND